MDLFSKLLNPLLGFILTLAFGFWLSRRGKPYHGLLFNVHKLIALATVILLGMAIYQAWKLLGMEAFPFFFLVLAVLSIIGLFASGALMSAGKGEYRVMKLIHNISPVVLVLSIAVFLYLFGGWQVFTSQ